MFPQIFLMNTYQNIMIVASEEDGVYCNADTNKFVDLDKEFNIKCISEMIYDDDDKKFYLLANKKNEKLGLYLV